jgi:hypothetical protein
VGTPVGTPALRPWLRLCRWALCVLLWQSALADVRYVDVNSTNATPPYRVGVNTVLTWPADFDTWDYTYHLQRAASPGPSAFWSYVLPRAAVISGQYTVRTAAGGTQQFYRLIQDPWPCTSNLGCPPGYICISSLPYNYCRYDLFGGGGCVCPCGRCICVGGSCYCAINGFGCGGGGFASARDDQTALKAALTGAHASRTGPLPF